MSEIPLIGKKRTSKKAVLYQIHKNDVDNFMKLSQFEHLSINQLTETRHLAPSKIVYGFCLIWLLKMCKNKWFKSYISMQYQCLC